jgi:hypothetical protein
MFFAGDARAMDSDGTQGNDRQFSYAQSFSGIAVDCTLFLFILQREFPRLDAVQNLSVKAKLHGWSSPFHFRLDTHFNQHEVIESIPVCLHNEHQSLRAAVTARVEFLNEETVGLPQ